MVLRRPSTSRSSCTARATLFPRRCREVAETARQLNDAQVVLVQARWPLEDCETSLKMAPRDLSRGNWNWSSPPSLMRRVFAREGGNYQSWAKSQAMVTVTVCFAML